MADIVCLHCKYIGKPRRKKRGSGRIEVMGWLLFPLGLPYSIWRMMAKISICKQCGSEFVVSASSIAGERLIRIAKELTCATSAGENSFKAVQPHSFPEAKKVPVLISPSQEVQAPAEHTIKPSQDPDVW